MASSNVSAAALPVTEAPRGRLGRRLLGYALALSLALALLLTAVQGVLNYRTRVDQIRADMDRITRVQATSLAAALWQYNDTELQLQVEGILHYPYITYVAVTNDAAGHVVAAAGTPRDDGVIERTIPLLHGLKGVEEQIGTLRLQVSSARVVHDLRIDLLQDFLSQTVAVAAVAAFLLILFQRMVIRHVSAAAAYFRRFKLAGGNAPLQLAKRLRHDELDTLVAAFNGTRDDLQAAQQQQQHYLEQLRDSEERFRVLFEQATDGIVVYDPDEDRFVDANAQAERLFGMKRDALKLQKPSTLLREATPGLADLHGGTAELECRTCRPDGSEVLCELRVVGLPSAGRRLIRMSLVDITDRMHAQQALIAAEARFRGLLETVRLAALMLDRDGRITFINDCLRRLTGCAAEDIIGQDWFERFVPEESREEARAAHAHAMAAGQLQHHEETRVIGAGSKLRSVVWDSTILRDADDSIAGLARIGVDVTDQRSIEEQLRHAQKMEAIGHLAGGIAHDFNNVLTVTLGMSGYLLAKMPPDAPHRDIILGINQASERATHLTRSLLAFSRKLVKSPADVDLNTIVGNVMGLLRRVIGEDLELRVETKAKPLVVHVDPDQIEQALINLATNSRDAMVDGGSLALTSERVDLTDAEAAARGLKQGGAYAVLSVADTGTGMTEETRQRIFEPFFTTKEVGKGTGLGLAIVYGIIESHNGHIAVESQPGLGSTFRIHLPLVHAAAAEAAAAAAAEETKPQCGQETILVAEDDDAVRAFLETLLRDCGYSVLTARDGQEAVEIYAERGPEIALVLMDLVMPRKSGRTAQQEIRRQSPDARILLLSGYTADLVKDRGELEPGVDLVLKPLNPDDLLRRLRTMLDGTGHRR